MNPPTRILLFREYRNWSVENVSERLGISIDTYRQIECGKTKIDGILAQKLSDLYQIPIEFFITDDTPHYLQAEVMYCNCTFSGSSNGYINHQYNDRGIDEILFSKREEIKNLKLQIEDLVRQNIKLTGLLDEKGKASIFY